MKLIILFCLFTSLALATELPSTIFLDHPNIAYENVMLFSVREESGETGKVYRVRDKKRYHYRVNGEIATAKWSSSSCRYEIFDAENRLIGSMVGQNAYFGKSYFELLSADHEVIAKAEKNAKQHSIILTDPSGEQIVAMITGGMLSWNYRIDLVEVEWDPRLLLLFAVHAILG